MLLWLKRKADYLNLNKKFSAISTLTVSASHKHGQVFLKNIYYCFSSQRMCQYSFQHHSQKFLLQNSRSTLLMAMLLSRFDTLLMQVCLYCTKNSERYS